eukprot:TRINITY_DN4274_c0_g2_i11.p1 TRINITY_DN4274_c0_g2~~TRINITY_DN4274_c0_g2_i11.p1  ORF type:complete len:291 (-),score=35.97 TRINITY_DN4274_c0_g2_i11:99-971(-)
MQKLKNFKRNVVKLLSRIRRYPYQPHRTNSNAECELDGMIVTDPKDTYFYFRFEYISSIIFNGVVFGVGIFFLIYDGRNLEPVERFGLLRYWLRIGIVLNFCSLLPKALILSQLFSTPTDNRQILILRLMSLARSNVFYWNEKLSFVLYNYYVFGLGKLVHNNICGSMKNNLYRMCNFILYCFILRFANLFVRFFAKHFLFDRTVEHVPTVGQGASQKEIDGLPVSTFSPGELHEPSCESQRCGICLAEFEEGDKLRTLPCSRKHFFHKQCTDMWLRQQYVCPYCRMHLR